MEPSKHIGGLSLDLALVNCRSVGLRFLHRRRGCMELQRLVVRRQQRVQVVQVPANGQLVPEHVYNGANWHRQIRGREISNKKPEHRAAMQRTRDDRLAAVLRVQFASGI